MPLVWRATTIFTRCSTERDARLISRGAEQSHLLNILLYLSAYLTEKTTGNHGNQGVILSVTSRVLCKAEIAMGVVHFLRTRINRCQISVGGSRQRHVFIFCKSFVKYRKTWKSLAPRLPTKRVTVYSATAGTLWPTLATGPMSRPVSSICWTP